MENTVKQAYTLKKDLDTLPKLSDVDLEAEFDRLCRNGMKKRGLDGIPEYEERLAEEKELIVRKKFPIYFVILQDALSWCRRNEILIGRGRGSSAGSLVAYVLEITDVDPIEYGLLFWRFLSDWRADWPDIDTDIADRDRHKLHRYLEEKYGADRVASITTFTYYTAKSAIKDACKVLAVPFKEANALSKQLPTNCIMDDFRDVKFKGFHETYPGVYKLAKGLEGRLQRVGYHAAGTVITEMPIADLVSLESRAPEGSKTRQRVVSLPKDDAEELGLIKYDFLGLTTLSVVDDCIKSIKKNHNKIIDIRKMSFDDPAVFESVNEGHTVGIFQSEGAASVNVIKQMGVKNFADLVVSNALPRSGAWDAMGPEYIAKKKGYKKSTYPTEESRSFLEETFGEMLYQEQTLLVCTEVAGLTREEADKIRKLTAKKQDPATLAPLKEKFIKGATATTSPKTAEDLWKKIEISAKYQFNKCLSEDTLVFVQATNYRQRSVKMLTTVGDLYQRIERFEDWDFYVEGPEKLGKGVASGKKWYRIKDVHDNGVKDIVRVWIDENWYIDSTKEHRHRLSKGWKEAYRIHQMDQIATGEGMKTVWKKTWEGQAHTYDIELSEEPHAFFANGIVTHNSHSVAYSQLSYITAMLKHYYPAEFMCALLNNSEDKVVQYLTECKRLGIPVKTPDVNRSDVRYEAKNGVIYMGLANIRNISETLATRIIHMRESGPKKETDKCHCIGHGVFESYEDLKERFLAKKSGISTRVLESLDKVGALRFHDHEVFEDEIKENFYEYLGIVNFDSAIVTPKMKERITPLIDFESKKTNGIMTVIVKDIVIKGWIRVDCVDESGSAGFFVGEDHGFRKGQAYLIAVAKGNIIASMDLSKFNINNPMVKYLRGEYSKDTYLIAAKTRITQSGNEMASMLFSYEGKLNEATVWSNLLSAAKKCRLGDKIRIRVKPDPKWGNTLIAILKDET